MFKIPKEWNRKHDATFSFLAVFIGLAFIVVYECNPALYAKEGAVIAVYVLVIFLIFFGVVFFLERLFLTPGIVVLCLAICGLYDANADEFFIIKSTITTTEWIAFISAVITFSLFALRTGYQIKQIEAQGEQIKMQNRQIKIQEKQTSNQEFDSAVKLLGSSETSGRSVAIYSLYNLAINSEEFRAQIAQILCSHIRSKTQEKEYKEEHKEKPSNEIQTAIDLLFRNLSGQEGLYCIYKSEFQGANLSNSYLRGAHFVKAHCQKVDFTMADCRGTQFLAAYCDAMTDFRGTTFDESTNFYDAECEDALFGHNQVPKSANKHSANQRRSN